MESLGESVLNQVQQQQKKKINQGFFQKEFHHAALEQVYLMLYIVWNISYLLLSVTPVICRGVDGAIEDFIHNCPNCFLYSPLEYNF